MKFSDIIYYKNNIRSDTQEAHEFADIHLQIRYNMMSN